jgi:hypothetical protein
MPSDDAGHLVAVLMQLPRESARVGALGNGRVPAHVGCEDSHLECLGLTYPTAVPAQPLDQRTRNRAAELRLGLEPPVFQRQASRSCDSLDKFRLFAADWLVVE